MSHKTVSNPIFEPWNPKVQDDYISYAYDYYVKVHGDPAPTYNPPRQFNWVHFEEEENQPQNLHEKKEETLSWLYRVGHEKGDIKISYQEFESAVLCGGSLTVLRNKRRNKNNRYWGHSHRNDTYWYDDHGVGFRQKMGYQKKENHNKKELSEKEKSRKEWRDKKSFNRDKRKDRHWGRGRKTFAKQISNRWNRRWEKRAIYNEAWDDFLTLKQIHDAWMWD